MVFPRAKHGKHLLAMNLIRLEMEKLVTPAIPIDRLYRLFSLMINHPGDITYLILHPAHSQRLCWIDSRIFSATSTFVDAQNPVNDDIFII